MKECNSELEYVINKNGQGLPVWEEWEDTVSLFCSGAIGTTLLPIMYKTIKQLWGFSFKYGNATVFNKPIAIFITLQNSSVFQYV